MKHLHYAGQVVAISDALAESLETLVVAHLDDGKSIFLPVAGYQDERDSVMSLLFGPGIPVMIGEPWIQDHRLPASHDEDSLKFFDDLLRFVESEQMERPD